MKLNTKRTILVGFAFFLISAFWQAYDGIVPLMLVNKFGLNQTWSGFIMALDNILALFMLPLFGTLSDKTNSRFGKRTPYILIGTIVAIACFVGLTFADNAQLAKLSEGKPEQFWSQNYEVANNEYDNFVNSDVEKTFTVKDYAAHVRYNKDFFELSADEQAALGDWYKSLSADAKYSYDRESNTYTFYEGAVPDGVKTTGAYTSLISSARSVFAQEVTRGQVWVLIIFIVLLLGSLVAMATFRSPAVALMPDVTVKPLRSKANAVINLMGTAGAMLVLGLGTLFGTGKIANQTMSYTGFVCAVCGIMLAALIIFMLTVREKKWNTEMLEQQAVLDAENPENVQTGEEKQADEEKTEIVPAKTKLGKDKLKSLILILASVALWFTGYNAITSKYSLYAVNVLDKDYNTTLLIAQAAAIVAYVPVGMLASKLGRKKTILIGVALLTAAFTGACFVNNTTPIIVLYLLFALAGIAWATINVNSFPMVVELSQGGDIGKYTGFYYTASMAAQIVTPILSGFIMDLAGNMGLLFPYGAVFVALSFVTMLFVKYGDSKPVAPKDKLEMLGGADD